MKKITQKVKLNLEEAKRHLGLTTKQNKWEKEVKKWICEIYNAHEEPHSYSSMEAYYIEKIHQTLQEEKRKWQKELKPTHWYERGLYDATKSVKEELVEKIEGMKKDEIMNKDLGYGQAIDEILKLLKP